MKIKIAYVAASIAALALPLLSLTVPMAGCSSSTATNMAGMDATPGTEASPGSEAAASTDSSSGGADTGTGLPPGATLVPLSATTTGYVSPTSGMPPNTVAVTGSWYAYGDGWGTEGDGGASGERGNCETIGHFPPSDCSTITSPLPAAPQVAVADGGAQPPPPAGYAAGFPPEGDSGTAAQTFCLTGVAAAVIDNEAGAPDYSDIYGIGSGFDFNNVGGTKSAYNAPAYNVIGVQFTISSMGAWPLPRVEFPTTDTTANPNFASYVDLPSAGGTYTVLWSQLETPFPPVVNMNIAYTPPVDGGIAAEPMFNPAHLLSIQFHVPTGTAGPVTVDGLCVSNLSAVVQGGATPAGDGG